MRVKESPCGMENQTDCPSDQGLPSALSSLIFCMAFGTSHPCPCQRRLKTFLPSNVYEVPSLCQVVAMCCGCTGEHLTKIVEKTDNKINTQIQYLSRLRRKNGTLLSMGWQRKPSLRKGNLSLETKETAGMASVHTLWPFPIALATTASLTCLVTPQ